jgi:Fic-DOC domain mobile mystery protein B
MFNQVWHWLVNVALLNLALRCYRIESELRQAIDDARWWIEYRSYPIDETAVRFHHRLVVVHPFLDGKGRWSRLAADLLVVQHGGQRFTWGRTNLQAADELRRAYIDALKVADVHDGTHHFREVVETSGTSISPLIAAES